MQDGEQVVTWRQLIEWARARNLIGANEDPTPTDKRVILVAYQDFIATGGVEPIVSA